MNTLYNSTVLITSFTFRIPAYYTSYYLSFTINSIFHLFFWFFLYVENDRYISYICTVYESLLMYSNYISAIFQN